MRKRIFQILEPGEKGDIASRSVDFVLIALILLSVLSIVLETVPSLAIYQSEFYRFEVLIVFVFTVEYVLRIYTCVESEKYREPLRGRIRYIFSPLALVDLIAIAPFYLAFLPLDMRFIRMIRVLRLFRLFRLGRYTRAVEILGRVVVDKRAELAVSVLLGFILIMFSAIMMFYVEHDAQPEHFESIPDAMWWAIVTLSTIGYGDVFPITILGRVLGAIIAALGVGMFALPTGIIGAAFVEEYRNLRTDNSICPHCGKSIQ